MRLIEQAFNIALSQDGVLEIPGPKSCPQILEYHKATTLKATNDDIAWCSAFANWCFQKAGGKGTRSAAARSWLGWGNEVKNPKDGELVMVVFERGNDGWSGHIAFCIWKRGAKFQRVFGGNQNNKVCWANYDASKILGCRTSKD